MTKLHVGGFVARTKSVQTCAVNFIAGIFGGRHDAMFGFDRSIVLAKIFKTCADSCSVDSSGDHRDIANDIDAFLLAVKSFNTCAVNPYDDSSDKIFNYIAIINC